jgi:glycosyltransferase involved in cell wall biosynthesis
MRSCDSSVRLRIAYLTTSLEVGGSERQLVALNRGLPDERYEKHIICMSGYGPLEQDARAAGAELHDLRYPRAGPGNRFGARMIVPAAGTLLRLARLVRRISPDILHTMLPVCNIVGAIAGRMARVPHLVCTKLALPVYRDGSRLIRVLEDMTDPWFELVHCKSRGIADAVAETERIPRDRMRIVYNGLMSGRYGSASGRGVRAEFGIPESAFVIGMLANLNEYKGHADVLRGGTEVLRQFPDAWFLFAGRDDGIGPGLRELADSLGIGGRVIFAGERRDVPEILASMDLLVCASHQEGFSNVLLEAMATGLPIVATNVGGNPEAVDHEVTGVIVEPRAPDQLCAAMIRMASQRDNAKAMGERARERVHSLFSYEAMIAGMEAFYAEILPTPRTEQGRG